MMEGGQAGSVSWRGTTTPSSSSSPVPQMGPIPSAFRPTVSPGLGGGTQLPPLAPAPGPIPVGFGIPGLPHLRPHPSVPGGAHLPLSSVLAAMASGASATGDSGGKVKVKQACLPCKRAHTACDERRPCKKCVEMGKSEQCVDVERKKPGRPKKNPIPESLVSSTGSPENASPGKTEAANGSQQQDSRVKRQRVDGPERSSPSADQTLGNESKPFTSTSSSPSGPFSSLSASGSAIPQHTPQPAQPFSHLFGQSAQERQEKELLNSAVTFLLDQVRSLTQTVELLKHEVSVLKSNQQDILVHGKQTKSTSTASSSASAPSQSFTSATSTSTSNPSSSSSSGFAPNPIPSDPSPHPSIYSSSSSTGFAGPYSTYTNGSTSTSQYSQSSYFTSPTSSTSSASVPHTSRPYSHSIPASSYSQPSLPSGPVNPLLTGTGTQYTPLSALPYSRQIMTLFPFLAQFDLASSDIPFVVDDLSKPLGVLRVVPGSGDDAVPPIFWYVSERLAELLTYPVHELLGKSVLTVYVPDDKTKHQLLPHFKVRPFSPVIPFSPLGVRKDGSILRLATRLQTFSNKAEHDWTIIVIDGIEEVSPSLGTSSMTTPHLPKWLGLNTTAFARVSMMFDARSSRGNGATIQEITTLYSPSGYRMIGNGLTTPGNDFAVVVSHPHNLNLVQSEDIKEGNQETKTDDLSDLLTDFPATVMTPDYTSWIADVASDGLPSAPSPGQPNYNPNQPNPPPPTEPDLP